jgi:hypothetical protein
MPVKKSGQGESRLLARYPYTLSSDLLYGLTMESAAAPGTIRSVAALGMP